VGPAGEDDDVGTRPCDDVPDDRGVVPFPFREDPRRDIPEEPEIKRRDRRWRPMEEGDVHPRSSGEFIETGGEVS